MHFILRTSLAVLVGLLMVPVAASAQVGAVTGIVTDAETQRPIAGASVHALTPTGQPAGTVTTNAEGRYRIALQPGAYTLSVETVGYQVVSGVPVTVTAGGAVTVNHSMTQAAFSLNPVVVSVSRGLPQKATDAPARVEVITERDIAARPTMTPVDHLRGTPGVDVITQGVQSTNVVARGFNNVFSGALHTITDHRLAGVPSLRVNVLHFVPSTNDDLQRMEVVLGPGAALYGPNTASGVLHMITKSPLVDQGTTASVTGGEQDIIQGSFRTSQLITDRLGAKLSAQVMSGSEWAFLDPDEVAEASKFTGDDAEFFRQDLIRTLGISDPAEADAEASRRIARIGNRDFDLARWSGEGRLDYQVTPEATAILQAGMTNVGSGIELTGLGAAQVEDWRYSYVQGRANWNRLFAQAYLNMSNAGDTYLLRTGQPIVDESTLLVGQVQHGFDLGGRQSFTYGLDYFYTNPQTRGTIHGIYEDEDETTEVGAYLQSETALSPKFDLVLAGRIDDHSALPDPVLSPRAALVFKPTEAQSLRATFNQAFSTPTSLNQFLDLSTSVPDQTTNLLNARAAQLGYSVRVQGTGTTGFTFQQPDGSYRMRSPFSPALGVGPAETLLPTNAALFFPAAVGALQQAGLFNENPSLGQYLGTLRPTAEDIGTNFIHDGNSLPIGALDLADIEPIRETTTTTYELGYKGVLQERFSIAADVWHSEMKDFVTPLTVSTPFIAMNGEQIVSYLVPRFMQDLQMSQEQAIGVATQVATGLAQVPVGVISSDQINATGAQMLATYTNVNESIEMWGVDIGLQALITPIWSLSVAGSMVSDDHFDTSVGVVTLNAPRYKGSVALAYRPEAGFNGEIRTRYNTEYPVRSGVYEATNCITETALSLPCVEAYTLVDLTLGYDLPQLGGASLQLSVQNLFDEGYRSFPGVPEIGRLALLRLKYDF